MLRRLLCALTALLLALASVSAMAEASVPRASAPYSLASLEKYDSFLLDESTGDWSVSDPMFLAVGDAIAGGEVRNSMNAGVLVFQFALSGNCLTGTILPSLEFTYLANSPLSARAVSLLVDGVRYDFETANVGATLGGYSAERLVAPLTSETLSLIPAIREAGSVTALVHGAEKVYLAEISREGANKTAKERLESASLSCTALYDEMAKLHIDQYALWDLTASQWKADLGTSLAYAESDTVAAGAYDVLLPSGLKLLYAGMRGQGVSILTSSLMDAGFYAGAVEAAYDVKTIAAVARAQSFYGLPVTGSADERLLAALESGFAAQAEPEVAKTLSPLSTARIAIDRWWIAGAVAPCENALAGVVRGDANNLLAVCEGAVRNVGSSELGLGWQLTGTITIDGEYAYGCAVRAEGDAGGSFATTVLPLAESRLIVTAEIPALALENAVSVELSLSLNGETLAYTLTK